MHRLSNRANFAGQRRIFGEILANYEKIAMFSFIFVWLQRSVDEKRNISWTATRVSHPTISFRFSYVPPVASLDQRPCLFKKRGAIISQRLR
jgi:hypothetical protein